MRYQIYRGVAQFGSALPWGGRGREFESRRSDQNITKQPQINQDFAGFTCKVLFFIYAGFLLFLTLCQSHRRHIPASVQHMEFYKKTLEAIPIRIIIRRETRLIRAMMGGVTL